MRAWAKRNDKKRFSVDFACSPYDYENCNSFAVLLQQQPADAYQYSFVGPLSMQKGCDNAFHMYTKKISGTNDEIGYESNKLSYRGMYDFLYPWIFYKICFR